MKELVVYPDERLRVKSQPVVEFGSALDGLVDDMTWVMRKLVGNAMGISAVQVGQHQRIGLLELDWKKIKKRRPLVLCNPIVMATQIPNVVGDEGCLSFPGKFFKIQRPGSVIIRYWDYNGRERQSVFDGMLARCMLHEIDHMDGILFIDRLVDDAVNEIIAKGEA